MQCGEGLDVVTPLPYPSRGRGEIFFLGEDLVGCAEHVITRAKS
jgi:hypothetical protein